MNALIGMGRKINMIWFIGLIRMEAKSTAATAPEAPMLAKPGVSLYLK